MEHLEEYMFCGYSFVVGSLFGMTKRSWFPILVDGGYRSKHLSHGGTVKWILILASDLTHQTELQSVRFIQLPVGAIIFSPVRDPLERAKSRLGSQSISRPNPPFISTTTGTSHCITNGSHQIQNVTHPRGMMMNHETLYVTAWGHTNGKCHEKGPAAIGIPVSGICSEKILVDVVNNDFRSSCK